MINSDWAGVDQVSAYDVVEVRADDVAESNIRAALEGSGERGDQLGQRRADCDDRQADDGFGDAGKPRRGDRAMHEEAYRRPRRLDPQAAR